MTLLTLVSTSCGVAVSDLEKKDFTDLEFKTPDTRYRPLPIIHATVDKASVFRLKELGYGGLVTNVSFSMYLENEEMWDDFESLTKYTIEDMGLRLWIYDERGYPSGSAGGLVLKDNPEWQSRGIVCLTAVSEGQETLKISRPYGHLGNVAAYAVKGTDLETADYTDYKDLSEYVDQDGTLNWTAPEAGWIAISIYEKNFFENTHSAFNWSEVRRYIDLLRKEPVAKFIDLTYQRYFDHVGQYFGKGIEAFFTDEPSLMGTYFVDPPPTTPLIIDTPDADIPLLATANYGDQLLSEFKTRRGYDAEKYLSLLFAGQSADAQRFRWDYYRTTSELVAENYTGQIAKFCEEHDIALSGHMLFEEDISKHPIFEGDYLQIMKNMQFPGIDLLTSHPGTALDWASTAAKFASSAADFSNRRTVMSEVSDAFDGVKGSVADRVGAVAVQYALGVNHINSYYSPLDMTEDENRLFTDTIGRFGYMLDGGRHVSRVAVYYPIEGIWTQTTPPENLLSFNRSVNGISNNFKEVSLELLRNQIDYDYLDYVNLSLCKIRDGSIVSPSNEKFSVLVVPDTPALDSKTISFMLDAADKGVKILLQNTDGVVTETGTDKAAEDAEFAKLVNHANTVSFASSYDISPEIDKFNIRDIKLSRNNRSIIYRKELFEGRCVYMLVNVSGDDEKITATFNTNGETVKIWDPYTGNIQEITDHDATADNLKLIGLEIGAGKAIFITIEQ
ncbi:MAG: glycosyl hydrolase [Saccharofermentanales bacterium]